MKRIVEYWYNELYKWYVYIWMKVVFPLSPYIEETVFGE